MAFALFIKFKHFKRKKNVIRPLRESVFSYKFSKMLLRVFHCLIENPAVILRSCETIELKSALGAKECLTFLSSSRCRSPAPHKRWMARGYFIQSTPASLEESVSV